MTVSCVRLTHSLAQLKEVNMKAKILNDGGFSGISGGPFPIVVEVLDMGEDWVEVLTAHLAAAGVSFCTNSPLTSYTFLIGTEAELIEE